MGVTMPKINVYLPDELADAVKDLSIPLSAVCQQALQQAVRRVSAIRETASLDLDLGEALDRLTQFTTRARTAIQLGADRARAEGAARIRTEHLLAGIVEEGDNLGLRIVRSLEIEPAEIKRQLAALPVPEQRSSTGGAAQKVDETAARALELTATEALALGHNYIGCEHLVLGLVTEPDGAAGQLLRSLGAEPRLARRAVAAALSGYVHAQANAQQPNLQQIVERLDRLERRLNQPPPP
jgi:ATP-dependent Clp protease ATP-binding subunit ClpA